jgi:glycosyltransferase involved in cell wall biosynthesis
MNIPTKGRPAHERSLELSVLIASRDRADRLRQTLDGLAKQDRPPLAWEVIVVDNDSCDDTARVLDEASQHLPLVRLHEDRPGKNRALNRALDVAAGRLLVFTDDDVMLPRGWLASFAEAAERWPDVSIFGGPIRPGFPTLTPDWIRDPNFRLAAEAFGAKPAEPEGYTTKLPYGANLAIRAHAFEARRFDEAIGPAGRAYPQGSEYELLSRLRDEGERIVHLPETAIEHVIATEQVEWNWLLSRAARAGRGAARIKRKRVPKRWLGWVPLYLRMAWAGWRSFLSRGFEDRQRFEVTHRLHYWRGYIEESKILWREGRGAGARTDSLDERVAESS